MDLLNRSEFLQFSSLLAGSTIVPQLFAPAEKETTKPDAKNIIVLLFDSLPAAHLPLHGYQRNTAPNLSHFSEISTIYHNHYAAGNFTSPGTASLLTGTYPFSHRAIMMNSETIPEFETKNIFGLYDDYYRIAYSHNKFADTLLSQFHPRINHYKPRQELFLKGNMLINKYFSNDNDTAQVSWTRILSQDVGRYTNSLFLSNIQTKLNDHFLEKYQTQFPRGLPRIGGTDEYFILEHAIDWISEQLSSISQPFLGYFHLLPPHEPYSTSREFIDTFLADGFKPIEKPEHLFTMGYSQNKINRYQQYFDEFILYADAQFERLYSWLEVSGLLDNSWIIFTSDHGELFERGIVKHLIEVLFQNIVHIPLMIHSPGQKSRQDVYSATSAVDVLPTLLHLSGKQIPDWCVGEILPPFRTDSLNNDRSIYTLEAKRNKAEESLTTASTMLIKWPYKLVEYRGYEKLEDNDPLYEMYELEADAEEIENIYSPSDATARTMTDELRETIRKADEPYTK